MRKHNGKLIEYQWYIIPKDHKIFKISAENMKQKYGSLKHKNKQIGWTGYNFDIIFSMSSQLWYNFNINDIKQYLISKVIIDKITLPSLTFSDIYNKMVISTC